MKKHLITSALPYANGPLHFGHIAGVYLPADIYTRHLKRMGERAIHISGSDEHGVAITQNAQKQKKDYKEYVDSWHKEHKDLFSSYGIEFDFFGQTSSEYHKEETLKWFDDLYEKGFIEKQEDQQLQCKSCSNYLPDRYVEGTCYECGYEKARGDECPNCGTWIDALKLKNPVCQFCESTDIHTVKVDQWYLMLSKFHNEFREWFSTKKDWKKTVWNFVDSLSKEGMIDRAITRDLDWGIDVPLVEAKGKKLYVWFDAPIGYVSNTKQYLESIDSKEDYLKDWWSNDNVKITNFIGKDNIIFHSIIFPVMSMASQKIRAVDNLPANQYVNLAGKQFSKSQGWYVDADQAIDSFGQDALRYYLATLIPENTDSSFEWDQFEARLNGELANNIGNFISRSFGFAFKNFPEGFSSDDIQSFWQSDEFSRLKKLCDQYHEQMNNCSFREALQSLMSIGKEANTYFSDQAPWAQMKEDPEKAKQTLCWATIYGCVISEYASCFMPNLSLNIQSLIDLNIETNLFYLRDWKQITTNLNLLKINSKPKPLVPKIDSDVLNKFKDQLK